MSSESELNLKNSTDLNKIHQSDLKSDNFEDDFDEDEIPAHIREARLNELKMRAREMQYAQLNKNDIYKEITEDEFLTLTTKSKKCIVHFFHPDFRRCDIMHTHLQTLASKYLDTKFAKINVEKAKFFVAKLNVQMLPAVMCFMDGILKHRIIGFDQLGNTDNFETRALEKKLWKLKFLRMPDDEDMSGSENENEMGASNNSKKTISNDKNNDSDSD